MNKPFTHHCFIRKNSPELHKRLEKLGYKQATYCFWKNDDLLCTEEDGEYSTALEHEDIDLLNVGYIDCGDNEDLFIAIAAIRNDRDINQFFINEKEISLVNQGIYSPAGNMFYCCNDEFRMDDKDYHKATLDELINFFNSDTSNKFIKYLKNEGIF